MARDCLGVRSRILARIVSNFYEQEMQEVDLRIGQMNLLVAIAVNGKMSPGHLADALQLEKSTISRDLQFLMKKTWIEAEQSAAGRTQFVSITDSGLAVIDKAYPSWLKAQKMVEVALGQVLTVAVSEAIDKHWAHIARELDRNE
jgi:DNA-binding MarR family transcriptional regulator